MNVLFDHNTPVPLRDYLPEHTVDTAAENGWNELVNSALLDRAEEHGYDAFITADQNMPYQQDLAARRLGFIVLPTNNWNLVQLLIPAIRSELITIGPGEVVRIPE